VGSGESSSGGTAGDNWLRLRRQTLSSAQPAFQSRRPRHSQGWSLRSWLTGVLGSGPGDGDRILHSVIYGDVTPIPRGKPSFPPRRGLGVQRHDRNRSKSLLSSPRLPVTQSVTPGTTLWGCLHLPRSPSPNGGSKLGHRAKCSLGSHSLTSLLKAILSPEFTQKSQRDGGGLRPAAGMRGGGI
jgi:hypothetical protein